MGCDDVLKDAWDFATDLVGSVADVVKDVVTDIWRELVMPILEKAFALLGFEGKIVINSYAIVTPIFTNGFLSPYVKAVINRLKNNTDLMQEIKNIFLVGEHVRIRKYVKYGLAQDLTPDSYMLLGDINLIEAQRIIETDVTGEPITILTGVITTPNKNSHCYNYLINNPGTTGYTFDQYSQTLDDGAGNIYIFDAPDPFVFDAVFDGYDIAAYLLNFVDYTLKTSLATYIIPASTYDVDDAVAYQNVTIDTAANDYTATVDDEIYDIDLTAAALQNVIPEFTLPALDAQPTHYEIRYTIDSDGNQVYWWFYDMINDDTTYPDLYADRSNLPDTADPNYKVLPIAPIKVNEVWLEDNPTSDAYIKTDKLLNKFGLDILELSKAFRDPDAGGDSADILDIFFMFGLNIATVDSEPSLNYLWEFFDDLVINTTDDDSEYILWEEWKSDYDLLTAHEASDFSYDSSAMYGDPQWIGPALTTADYEALERHSATFKHIRDNPIVIMNEGTIDEYEVCPIPRQDASLHFCMTDYDAAAKYWGEGYKNVQSSNRWNSSFIVKSDTFNGSYNYGPAVRKDNILNSTIPGIFATQDTEKEIDVTNTALILRKRDAADLTKHSELTLYNLTAFNVVQKDADNVKLTALDFVGDDADGANVANNFLIPLTYSHLDDFGIVARQQILQEAANVVLYGYVVTEIKWYETAAFLKFFDFVLKVASIVYVFFSGDLKGAQLLWSAVKYYGGKLVVEKIIQKIILDNPDSDVAIALAVAYGVISIAAGDGSSTVDYALTAVHATSTVSTVYVQVKSDILSEEFSDWTESTKEEQERLKEAFDNLDTNNQSLIDYIKKQVTIRLETPEVFMTRTLDFSPTDEFLELAHKLDLDFKLEKPVDTVTETT